MSRFRRVLERAFTWDSLGAAAVQTVAFNAVLWMLSFFAGWEVYKLPLFWAASIVGVLLLIGIANSLGALNEQYQQQGVIRRIIYDENQDPVLFLPIVAVRNLGAPTAIEWSSVTLELESGETISCEPRVFLEDVGLTVGENEITVSPDQQISRKTAEDPIPTGGFRTGYFPFLASGIRRDQATAAGTRVRICFQDIVGNETCIEMSVGGKASEQYLAFPGVDPEIRRELSQ